MSDRRRAIITGAGRGIGRHAALYFARAGYALSICARTASELAATADRIRAEFGTPVHVFVCDLGRPGAPERMIDQAVAALGGVDVLVNNAGIAGPIAPLEDADFEDWRRTIDVNLIGLAACTRAAIPHLKRAGRGKIVNLAGGRAGWRDHALHQSAYIASKFAVCGFTEAIARELEEFDIQVNALSPGNVDTSLSGRLGSAGPDAAAADDRSPEAAARMLLFLASPESGPLTGKLVSARWDDPADLAREAEELNRSCRLTLRKIDGRHYDLGKAYRRF